MSLLFNILDNINNIYDLQREYFFCMKKFLKKIREEYVNIMKYYKEPELAFKCIDYDINLMAYLLRYDKNDNDIYKFSNGYHKNLLFFKNIHKNLYNKKDEIFKLKMTDSLISSYFETPHFLDIEIKQYLLY